MKETDFFANTLQQALASSDNLQLTAKVSLNNNHKGTTGKKIFRWCYQILP